MNELSIDEWLRRTTKLFNSANIQTARLDAELLFCFASKKSREWLVAHGDKMVTFDFASNLINRRLNREPVAYITGEKEFYGRDFIVTPDTLIPRPETEQIISILMNMPTSSRQRILDVGTGLGVLAVTAVLESPESIIVASDISEAALEVAKKNALVHGATTIEFVKSDLLKDVDMMFDTIIANLPYVAKDWSVSPETDYEPDLALFAADGGTSLIKSLIDQATSHLLPNGYIILEMDPRQIDIVEMYAKRRGFKTYEKHPFTLVLEKQSVL